MSIKIFQIKRIRPPKLLFHDNKVADTPMNGLNTYGPWDLNERHFDLLRIILIYPKNNETDVREFTDLLNKEARILRIKLKEVENIPYEPRSLRSYETVSDNLCNMLDKLRDKRGIIILQFLAEREEPETSFYIILRRRIYQWPQFTDIPIQSIILSKWVESKERVQYIRNLLLAMYTKIGGTPWLLANNASKLFNNSIFIGYKIQINTEKPYVVATSFGPTGRHILTAIEDLGTPSNRNIVFRNVLRDILSIYKKFYEEPKLIIWHRNGDLGEYEIELMRQITNREIPDAYSYIISFPDDWSLPLLSKENSSIKIADSGYYFYAGIQKETPTFFIQTISPTNLQGKVINMVKFRIILLTRHLLEKFTWSELAEDAARQILYLTRLNWGSIVGLSTLPATMFYLSKAERFREMGIKIRFMEKLISI